MPRGVKNPTVIKVVNNSKHDLPVNATEGAAAFDLRAVLPNKVFINTGVTMVIDTGLKVSIPKDYCMKIYARSGLASKQQLAPINAPGIVDSDYRGPVKVALHNFGTIGQWVEPGDRIAQGMF